MSEYLAIKNWDKYQPPRNGKHSDWIKDYTEKESDTEYRSLTVFQRYILDGCRRICGRLGHNIPNDARYISNALSVSRSERGHVGSALRACTDRGLLVITNQQLISSLHKKENEIRKEEPKPSATRVSEHPKLNPDSVFGKAYECYPRHIGKEAAEKAWGKAINRESAKCVRTYGEHEDFIYQKVMHYGAVMRRKLAMHEIEKQFIPHMATWLNRGSFGDEPTEWEEQRNGDGASKAERRVAHMAETTREVFGGSGSVLGNGATGLPDTTASRGAGDVAGDAKRLLARRASAGSGSPDS